MGAASAAMRSPAVRRAEASSDRDLIVLAPLPQLERPVVYPNATANRLEHRSTKLAVVRARNPLETMSWLRMLHLPLRCSPEFIKTFRIPGRNYQAISPSEAGGPPEPPSVQTSSSGTIAFKRMGKENARAHQAHHRCNRLNHRTSPLRPCTRTERLHRCTVKKIHRDESQIGRE